MSRHGKNPANSHGAIWKYGAALGAFACLSLAHLPAAAEAEASSPNTLVSSDGERIAVKPAFGANNSYQGTGILPSVRLRETASEFQALLNARPMTAPSGIESIIGADQRMRVNPTTSFPARATVLITFDPPGAGTAICSGWMIGKNTVATAGHCVASGGSNTFYSRATYRIYPGRNGGASPYGVCTAKNLYTVNGWKVSGRDDYDYGMIKLNCNVGNTVGWYGFFWQSATLVGKPITTQGYPGDKPLTQWKAMDQVRANDTRRVFYQADTVGGQSGSPVWQQRAAGSPFCVGRCGLAIHAYGTGGTGVYATNNHGTRINQEVFNNLVTVKNLP